MRPETRVEVISAQLDRMRCAKAPAENIAVLEAALARAQGDLTDNPADGTLLDSIPTT